MYCKQCGKEISDQAKFCNHCGAKVTAAQPAQQPKPAQAAQSSQPAAAPRKKGKAGIIILIIIIILAAIGRYGEDYFRNGGSGSDADAGSGSGSSSSFSFASDSGEDESSTGGEELMATCMNGAIYTYDYLTYGQARVYAPGYSLAEYDGSSTDYLVNYENGSAICVNQQIEVGSMSYSATEGEDIVNSYKGSSGYSNVGMYEFKKYKVNGYPVIRYIAGVNYNGADEYIGELIICPNESPSQTMRITVSCLAEYGYGPITSIFDSLDISADYGVKSSDSDYFGVSRITVR